MSNYEKIKQSLKAIDEWFYLIQDIDGTNLQQLTDDDLHKSSPAWSPDGIWVIFHSYEEPGSTIYKLNLVNGEKINLTKSIGGYNIEAQYSPDGHKIAFIHWDADSQTEHSLDLVKLIWVSD